MLIPRSSLGKKYLMALTGFIFCGFVLIHMLGNLQIFLGPQKLNLYAHMLKTLPIGLLWGGRLVLILSAILHVTLAIILTRENRQARPVAYATLKPIQATLSSKTMGLSGSLLFAFIAFHLLHFTIHWIHPEYDTSQFLTVIQGKPMLDVYHMVLHGFSYTEVAVFYIVAMAALALHLSHGVSSMFQSLGLRNHTWRPLLSRLAKLYGWLIFTGFSVVPLGVLISKYTHFKIFHLG